MKLQVCYPIHAGNNGAFKYIYDNILWRLQREYPSIDVEYVDTTPTHQDYVSPGAWGGVSNICFLNPDNNRCSILSFWDRGMNTFYPKHGFDDFKIVQVFGGLSIVDTPEEIKKTYGVEYTPFQYPVAYGDFREVAARLRIPYDPTTKIRKAVFAGAGYADRSDILSVMQSHPLVEILEPMALHEYYATVCKYAICLSLNGQAEAAMRDFEIPQLGIPTIRSELRTQFYNKLIPDVHYIRGSEPCAAAWFTYPQTTKKAIAEQFIARLEEVMFDDQLLIDVSKNGYEYHTKYTDNAYMVELFFSLFKVDKLYE